MALKFTYIIAVTRIYELLTENAFMRAMLFVYHRQSSSLTLTSPHRYLKELMPGLTAKVFRTYNASYTLDQELNKLEDHPDKKYYMKNEQTQLKFYNDANYQVSLAFFS